MECINVGEKVVAFPGPTPDTLVIRCPECQQEATIKLVDRAGVDGFRVDRQGRMTPEFVCQRHYVYPDKSRKYCRFCGELTLLLQ
jgi:hypothetical protein